MNHPDSDDSGLLVETIERFFADQLDDAAMRRARGGAWLDAAWDAIEDMGLPLALVDASAGGFGIAPRDALALVRLSGRHALPLPLAETMIANRALAAAGLPLAAGPAAFVPAVADISLTQDGEGWRLGGNAVRVPWGRAARTLVVETGDGAGRRLARLETGWRCVGQATNVAAMPRDTIAIDTGIAAAALAEARGIPLLLAGAAIRTLEIAGALERILELTIAHVGDRAQFGRALSTFQAVQHELARVAGEVAAADAAANMAVEAFAGSPAHASLPIAAARTRTGEAIGIAAAIAQQLHGAIGFTEEHRLHWYTTALWAWRDEYGGQRRWTDMLGAAALAAGGAGFWQFVTAAA